MNAITNTEITHQPNLYQHPKTIVVAPQKPVVSVVIPLYNEVESIDTLYAELDAELVKLNRAYEVIVIDDGSTDGSFAKLKQVHERNPAWRIIRFRRNFGQTAGITAGFNEARGEIIVTLDADLQNDPAYIGTMLEKMEEGYDIVSGWRKDRKEPFFSRRLPSMVANGLISRITGIRLHDYGCSLKAYRSDVAKNVRLYGELHRFIPAIASWMGISYTEVPIADRPRQYGKSKYNLSRTFKVFLDLISVAFFLVYSTRPLHVFGGIGLVLTTIGTLLGIYLAYGRLFLGESLGDRPILLLVVMMIILGVQMISIGLLAEIMIRNYYEPQEKKIYAIREQLGGDDTPHS